MRAFIRSFATPLLVLFVAGCATQAERAAQVEREVEGMIQLYGPGCKGSATRPTATRGANASLKLANREDRYNRYPISTNCIRHRGFTQCTTF